jgi:hypothetical protein
VSYFVFLGKICCGEKKIVLFQFNLESFKLIRKKANGKLLETGCSHWARDSQLSW